jgi:hypothetical protein
MAVWSYLRAVPPHFFLGYPGVARSIVCPLLHYQASPNLLSLSSLAFSARYWYHRRWWNGTYSVYSMGYFQDPNPVYQLLTYTFPERFTTLGEPLIPLYLFKNRNYVCLMIVASVGSMIFYALAIVWPQQIAALYGASQEATGWISVSTNCRP